MPQKNRVSTGKQVSMAKTSSPDDSSFIIKFNNKEQIISIFLDLLSKKFFLIFNPNLKDYEARIMPKNDTAEKSSTRTKHQSTLSCVIAENNDLDLKKLINLRIVSFTYNETLHDKPIFQHFSPHNNSLISTKTSTEIDLEYIRKKFDMLMDLQDFFLRKYFFEALSIAVIKNFTPDNESQLIFYHQQNNFQKAQADCKNAIKLFTEQLTTVIQSSIFEDAYELSKGKSIDKDKELYKIDFEKFCQQHPELLLTPATQTSLTELQADLISKLESRIEELPKYIRNFQYSTPSQMEARAEYGSEVKDFYESLKENFASIDPNTILMFKNSFLKRFDILLIDDFFYGENIVTYNKLDTILSYLITEGHNSFEIVNKNLVKLLVFGYYNIVELFQKLQSEEFGKALLSDSQEIFSHKLSSYHSIILDIGDLMSFDRWVMLNEFRLNINYLLYEGLNPYEDRAFPENFKKNIWNLLLFTRDVTNINNLTLDFLIHNSIKENSLEIFLQGRLNHSASTQQNIDCIESLIANGLAFFSDLKTLDKNQLIDLIKANFGENFGANVTEGLEKKLNILEDFENKLINKTIKPDEIHRILDSYKTHLDHNNTNITKPITKSKEERIENILNLTAFLTYLDRCDYISHIATEKTDKSSQKLLEKINKLILYLDPKSKLYQDSITRNSLAAYEAIIREEEKEKEREREREKGGEKGGGKNKTKKYKKPQTELTQEEGQQNKDKEEYQEKSSIQNSEIVEENKVKIITEIQEEVTKNIKKFDSFFKYLRQRKWINPVEMGLYGSRVYSELLKKTKPALEVKLNPNADFDFFCISEQIFGLMADKDSAQKNFQEFLDEFNKISPDFKVSFKLPEDKATNFSYKNKSLNFKLVACFNDDKANQIEFDLSFYTPDSVKHNMQWQYNFERLMLCQNQDNQYEIKVNNHHANEMNIHQFMEQARDRKQDDFLYSANSGATGYLSRIYHKKGVFKYLAEEEIDKIKTKLLLDKNIEQQLREDYDFYLSSISSPDDNKSRVARAIVEMVNTDKILGTIAPFPSPHKASIKHHKLKETITTL